jgi:hypothetical protein
MATGANTNVHTGLWLQDEKKKRRADALMFNDFMDQKSLLDNPEADLMVPKFFNSALVTGGKKQKRDKVVEGMLAIFNQRKNQILERRAQPGISQTRLDYQ